MTEQELTQTIKVLRKEVEVLTSRTRDRGTGYIHTALDVINGRIDELMQEALYRQNELTGTLRGINGNLDADVYDGYKDHTEAMEQTRLRGIQDSAAGRKPNKVRDAYLYSSRVKEDEPVNRKAVTQDEMSRFYNNGPHIGARQNDDGTWDMSAAARMATDDDVEHTKEYYDTESNKSQSMTSPHKNVYDNASDIQNMSSDGLSNHSMKQKYGHAVQTTSEMMEEELEPLPINTFE